MSFSVRLLVIFLFDDMRLTDKHDSSTLHNCSVYLFTKGPHKSLYRQVGGRIGFVQACWSQQCHEWRIVVLNTALKLLVDLFRISEGHPVRSSHLGCKGCPTQHSTFVLSVLVSYIQIHGSFLIGSRITVREVLRKRSSDQRDR